jgi:hypothetical protein
VGFDDNDPIEGVGDLAALVLEDFELGLWTDFSCFKEDNLILESEDIFLDLALWQLVRRST